jgi:hypothetical protein
MHRDAVMQPSLCAEAGIREGWLLRLAGEKCKEPHATLDCAGPGLVPPPFSHSVGSSGPVCMS